MKHAGPPPPDVSRETSDRLEAYLALLLRWNARINLVAERDPEAIRRRHLDDALQLLPLVPPGDGPLADLGAGAGLPGLVLACALDRPVHLVESDQRKAAFLAEAVRHLVLPRVTVHAERIEAARLPPLAVVTARALAPLPRLLALAAPLLAPGGAALFPKGRGAAAELTEAARDWTMNVEQFPSRTAPDATLLRLSEIRRVGA